MGSKYPRSRSGVSGESTVSRSASIRGAQALLICAAVFSCTSNEAPMAPPAVSAGHDPIVGSVNGRDITLAALDEWIRDDLFESEAGDDKKLYELRSRSLEKMIDEVIKGNNNEVEKRYNYFIMNEL